MTALSRRALLAGGAAVASAAVLGCTSGPAEVPSEPAPSTPAADPTTAAATTRQPTVPLRFAVASDGHLGDPKATGDPYPAFVEAVNRLHSAEALDFVVLNGDLAQGGLAPQRAVKKTLAGLAMPYFVTPGNHDELTDAQWRSVWGTEPSLVQRFGSRSIILANTSNAAGDFRCANRSWLQRATDAEARQSDLLVFFHITPKKWTTFGVDCPGVRKQLGQVENLRAVFNGHDHDQDGVKTSNGVPYLFDGHLGGHWGTPNPGFRVGTLDGRRLRTRIVTLEGAEQAELVLKW